MIINILPWAHDYAYQRSKGYGSYLCQTTGTVSDMQHLIYFDLPTQAGISICYITLAWSIAAKDYLSSRAKVVLAMYMYIMYAYFMYVN